MLIACEVFSATTTSDGSQPYRPASVAAASSKCRHSRSSIRQASASQISITSSIARRTGVGDDYVVIGALLGAGTGKAEFQRHFWSFSLILSV